MSAKLQTLESKQATNLGAVSALVEHPFVAGMKLEHLRKLVDCSMLTSFPAHDVILREGEPANRFYLIRNGSLAIEWEHRGTPSLIQIIGAGDVLGWSWLFPPYLWRFTARTLEPTQAIFFYATPLRDECEVDPEFGYELMKRSAMIMLERLQSTRRKLAIAELKNATATK